MKYNTILFDLDGTLIDTNELIISSFEHTLKTFFPHEEFNREEIVKQLGGTLSDILSFYYERVNGEVDKGIVAEMFKVYRKYNTQMHDQMVVAFPNVVKVLEELVDKGIKLGIVTTKHRLVVDMGIQLTKISDLFDTVVTIDDVKHPKPHPEPVLKAMSELGALPETTLMVGDSGQDMESGKRAGIDVVGVAWSLKGEQYLQSFAPTFLIKDMRDLLAIVEV